jgi:hypothetical protein
MKRYLSAFLLPLACTLLLSVCSQVQQQQETKEERQQAEPEMPAPLYLGTVHQVFPADKFVLLRLIGPIPPEGTVLISHPADGTADRVGNLIVSATQHARNGIVAADIRAGFVLKGDRVFKYRSISAEPEEEEEQDTQEPFTLTGVELDVGYTPSDIKEKLQQDTPQPEQEEAPGISAETTVLPEDEPVAPAIPDTPPNNKLDDIPDTIDGWDSF